VVAGEGKATAFNRRYRKLALDRGWARARAALGMGKEQAKHAIIAHQQEHGC